MVIPILDKPIDDKPSPYELGKHLFGRYGSGRDDLSINRKHILREILDEKFGDKQKKATQGNW
jgi:hypothetical protein